MSKHTRRGRTEEKVFRHDFRAGTNFRALRLSRKKQHDAEWLNEDGRADVEPRSEIRPLSVHPNPGRIAARLLTARAFDGIPDLFKTQLSKSLVVILEVADETLLAAVAKHCGSLPIFAGRRVVQFDSLSSSIGPADLDVVSLSSLKRAHKADKEDDERRAFAALQLAVPVIAICPRADGYVPSPLIRAATHRIELPSIDMSIIAQVTSCVTGVRLRPTFFDEGLAKVGFSDLLLAVRFDRSTRECLMRLANLAEIKIRDRGRRDLSLDDIHGADDAVEWARSLRADIDAWRRKELSWDEVRTGANAVFYGPPGTGKTTIAAVAAAELGLHFVPTSYAAWQGADEAHLGHMLRAMEKTFRDARSNAPSLILIDECDSFPNRDSLVGRSESLYFNAAVAALLEQIDGVKDGAGAPVVVIGACNNIERCDPALLRSGRLNRRIRIGYPNSREIVAMLRVRLRGDLTGEDLDDLGRAMFGATGADVERVVGDARRTARQAKRQIRISDLRSAAGADQQRTPAELRRVTVHEAAHIVTDVVLHGGADVEATITRSGTRDGMVVRSVTTKSEGTYAEYHRRLQVVLAGRTGEFVLLGSPSDGAGGKGSDLETAAAMAAAMAGSLGLAGSLPLVSVGMPEETSRLLSYPHVLAAVAEELKKAEMACRAIIEANLAAVEWTASELAKHGSITGWEVEAAITRLGSSNENRNLGFSDSGCSS